MIKSVFRVFEEALQPQKIARVLKFWIKEVEGLYYLSSKTKALISCTVTAGFLMIWLI